MTEITKREKAEEVVCHMIWSTLPAHRPNGSQGLQRDSGIYQNGNAILSPPPPGMQRGQKQMGLGLLEHAASERLMI